jgi:DNA polymerase III subunit gamma/tau
MADMNYIVTARKWRPMTFADVVGQQHVSATLKNAILQNRIGHAYIFSGPRGVGKTTIARILARVLNCARPVDGDPCNECESCREISGGRNVDVFEIDGASNRGVEEIRNLREAVRYAPAKARFKVYIIDEVHMLTKEAFNALLKTLEEPPPHVLFIFATTEVHKVPATILSRCQRFDFHRIAIKDIIDRLRYIAREEGITIDEDALLFIAKKGDGSMRDAQSIFDQVIAFCGMNVTAGSVYDTLNIVDQELYFEVTDVLRNRDTKQGLTLVARVVDNGYDLREFLVGLAEHLRNLLTVITTDSTDLLETSAEFKSRYQTEAKHFTDIDMLRYLRAVLDIIKNMKWNLQPRLLLESGIVELIKMEKTADLQSLISRLDELKKNSNGSQSIPIMGTARAGWAPSPQVSPPAVQTSRTGKLFPPQIPGIRNTAPASMPGKTISIEEAFARWDEFVSTVRNERINLGSVLGQSTLIDVQRGYMTLRCDNDYQLNTIKRHKDFLSTMCERVFGAKTGINVSLNNTPSAVEEVENEHPVIGALRRELGAEPI